MARPLRHMLPGIAVHLVHRGSNRAACFRSESDYLLYLMQLRELSRRFDCQVHAYCLMTNHVHLLVSPPSVESGTALMKKLAQRHAQYFNRTYGRTGPLWDGRYRSCVAESARYVLACHRYIELNPVRAGMVAHPAEYRWSSYRANAWGEDQGVLTPHAEFLALGSDDERRRSAYAMLCDDPMEPSLIDSIRGATNGGYPLGSDMFKARFSEIFNCKTSPSPPGKKPRKIGV